MAGQLEGKVAVITGGGSGIGRATALRFIGEGARVVVADCDPAGGRTTIELAGPLSHQLRFIEADISREGDVVAMIELAMSAFGRLDCVFNNAGIAGVRAPLVETTVDELQEVLSVNLIGVFLGLKHGGRAMKAQAQGGSLISTASVAGLINEKSPPIYGVTKAAVVKLTQLFASELGPDNIRVNSIAPGPILTAKFPGDPEQWRPLLCTGVALPRVGEPSDIADAAVFLASDQSRYITGSTLVVDGGMIADGAVKWMKVKQEIERTRARLASQPPS